MRFSRFLILLALGGAQSPLAHAIDVRCATEQTRIFTLDGILTADEIRALKPGARLVTRHWGEVTFTGLTITGNSMNLVLPNGKQVISLVESTVGNNGIVIARAGTPAGDELQKLVRVAPKPVSPESLPEPRPRTAAVAPAPVLAPEPPARAASPNAFPVERFWSKTGALLPEQLKSLRAGDEGIELMTTHLGQITFLGMTATGNSMNIRVGGKQTISILTAGHAQAPVFFARAGTPAADEIVRFRGEPATREAALPRAPVPAPPRPQPHTPPVRIIAPPRIVTAEPVRPEGPAPPPPAPPAPAPMPPRAPALAIPTEPPRVAAGRPPAPVPEPASLGKYFPPEHPSHAGSALSVELESLKDATRLPRRDTSDLLARRLVGEHKAALATAIDWQGVEYIIPVPARDGKPNAATRLSYALSDQFPGVVSLSMLLREPEVRSLARSFRVPPLQYQHLDGKIVVIVDDGTAGPARIKAAAEVIAEAGGIPRILMFGSRER